MHRRHVLTGLAFFGLSSRAGEVASQAMLTDDGLYSQPWFLESFLHLGEDRDAAAAAGKHLAIMWELRGCPYCRQMHLVNFADQGIAQFIQRRFDILQLNILGAREVIDFDGEKLSEKDLARKYDVRSTPTFQFFPPSGAGLKDKRPREREAFRAQGYLPPQQFHAMLAYVAEHGYERAPPADDSTDAVDRPPSHPTFR